jgi:hypothetical protein
MASRWTRTAASPWARAALVLLLVVGVCAAVAAATDRVSSGRGSAPLFSVRGTRGTRRVVTGGAARFRLTIVRNRPPEPKAGGEQAAAVGQPDVDRPFAGPVRLSVGRLPAGITARFRRDPVRGTGTELVLVVAARTRPGNDRIVVRGHADGETAAASLRLVLSSPMRRPTRGSFSITDGRLGGTLAPGVSLPVDLKLFNPHAFALRILSLSVRVRSVSAANASRRDPCTTRDFFSSAFTGHYGFRLGSRRKISLGGLGFSTQQWPHVGMVERSVNQDGCKQATVTLVYAGTATTAGS